LKYWQFYRVCYSLHQNICMVSFVYLPVYLDMIYIFLWNMSYSLDQYHFYIFGSKSIWEEWSRVVKPGSSVYICFISDFVKTLDWRPSPVSREPALLLGWVVGLEIWVKPGPAVCKYLVCGSHMCFPPPSLLCRQLPGPQRQLLLEAYFWLFPTTWHWIDVWLYNGVNGPHVEHSRSLANTGPYFHPTKVRRISEIFQKFSLLSTTLYSSFKKKRGVGGCNELVPRILYHFRSNLWNLYILDVLYLELDLLQSMVWSWENFLDSELDGVFFGVHCFIHSNKWWKIY
jgi:hypothetical protein